jgi:hypothetical protein
MFSSSEVEQVNIPAESGMMGILAGHVPTLEALKPGVLEVIESGANSKKWFSTSWSEERREQAAVVLVGLGSDGPTDGSSAQARLPAALPLGLARHNVNRQAH